MGTIGAGRLKESGITHWTSPNIDALNDSKFSALPGGSRYSNDGVFYNLGYYGVWWSTSESNLTTALFRNMYYLNNSVYRGNDYDKANGFSVRCLRDF